MAAWLLRHTKDKQEYEAVCWALGKYLTNHVGKSSHSLFDFSATRLLSLMARKQNTKIYTFNYTPLDLLLRVMNITDTIETVYIQCGTMHQFHPRHVPRPMQRA